MKRKEDIERIDLEELEKIASDSSVPVPESLHRRVEGALTAACAVKSVPGRKAWRFALIPAAVAVAAALTVGLNYQSASRTPADTFTDPQEAYAELERTFGYISSKINAGREMTDAALSQVDKASRIIDNINKK